ncbi:carbon-nitrogen hydrolase [Parathielavia appendiculata]|uniref:Carbon-nitrogen hydrolase n=1 Tax=Parathielavia appendiculata TaxID=2587402 RepID=A0AAN6TW44_9PEZI|nr:carbon-nitrogen hydrolase [Parathielavia appendiculata]
MAPKTIRLGTASPGTQANTAETLTQLEQLARRAASKKVDILLLPEAYIGGYPRGTHFGCVIGSRSQEGRDEYLSYFQSAVDLGDTVGDGAGAGQAWVDRQLPSDMVAGSEGEKDVPNRRGDGTREVLERIALETGVFIVTGLIEKAGGSLYCSVVYVCPKRGIIGKRRKVMPTGTERLIWAQGSPATLRAVSTTIRGIRINLAAAICWENYMPLVRQALYAQNINLYLAPTADGRDTWLSLLRTTAIEGRCFVVSSNMCVRNTPTTSPATNGNTIHPENGTLRDGSPFTHSGTHHRRHSVLDENGNEIVLPCSPPPRTTSRGRTRRQSVFDEDGNEIVLCCGKRQDDKPATTTSAGTTTTTSTPPVTNTTASTNTAAGKESRTPGFVSRGGSVIVGPMGDVLTGPQWEDDSGIIFADVDFEDCIRGRLDLDTAGSYSRNDSFRFEVRGLDLSPLPY